MNLKMILSICMLLIASVNSYSQTGSFPFKNLKLKKVGVLGGVEQDRIIGNNMSHSYFNSLTQDPSLNTELENRVDSYFGKYSGVCENPHFKINLVYELPKNDNELHLNLVGVFNRVDGIYYSTGNYDEVDYEYFNYDLYSHEIALESNYLVKEQLKILPGIFDVNLYGLLGTNIGYQFANTLYVSGNQNVTETKVGTKVVADYRADYGFETGDYFNNYYDTSDAINQRVYAGAGFGFQILDRLEVGAMGRFGYGYRYHFSNDFTPTNLRSFEVNAKWILK